MNPQDLLSQLRDVRAPADIGWWPIAPGWWVLSIMVLVSLISIIHFLVKKHKKNAWRRESIREFMHLKKAYIQSPNHDGISNINTLLKRAITCASHDNTNLSKTGESWALTLAKPLNINSKTENILSDEVITILSLDQYRKSCEELDLTSLNSIEKWIKHLK